MSVKTVIVCDGCGEILKETSDIYYMTFKTDSFWSGADSDYLQETLHFCFECAKNIKQSLEKIAESKAKIP